MTSRLDRASSSPLPRPHALERWREEIHRGVRSNDVASFDDLAAAAANESAGLQAESLGHRGEAGWYYDCALLRLNGCHHDPDDGTERKPGPGRLMLRKLKAGAGDPDVKSNGCAPISVPLLPPRTQRRHRLRAGLELEER